MYQVMILVKNQEKMAKIAQIALNHQYEVACIFSSQYSMYSRYSDETANDKIGRFTVLKDSHAITFPVIMLQ